MAPELEDHWFERRRKGRKCATRTIAWQGHVLTAAYAGAVALAAAFLAERSILGFIVALAVVTGIFFVVVRAKTRCERGGRG